MEEVLNAFLRFIQDTNFVIVLYELTICSMILRRRRLFFVRLLVFVPYIALTNNVVGVVDVFNEYLIVGEIHFGYILYFFVSIFLVWFCFEEKFTHVLYFCTAAYIVENFGSQIGNILYLTFFEGSTTVTDYNDPRPLLYSVYRELLEIPIFLVVVFCFVNKYKKNYEFRLKNSSIAVIEIFTLLIIVFLNYYATMDGDMNVVTRIYAAIVDITLLLFQFVFFNETRLQYENDVTAELLKIQAKQHELAKENVELINVKCHDLKRQISALRLLGGVRERENAICELESAVSFYDSVVKTGNETLDILMMEKMLVCNQNHIVLSCIAEGKLLDFMQPSDLYTLFSNALDNAIESVMKVEPEKRNVILQIEHKNAWIKISMENYCSEKLSFSDGVPITTKDDKRYHGYGTKSIRSIAGKYGGTVAMAQEGERFVLRVLIPYRAEN